MDPILIAFAWTDPASWLAILKVAVGLGTVIFVHELGHFLVAKACGVKCEKFYIGFDFFDIKIGSVVLLPRALVKFQWGETEYGVGIIPLGGYVKMVGEDPDEEVPQADVEKSFAHKSLTKRIAIVVAGPGFNLLLAVLLLMIVFMFYGVPVMSTQVSAVEKDSPAEMAGVAKGDRIMAIDGAPVKEWTELSSKIKGSGGKQLNLQVRRGEETVMAVAEIDEYGRIGGREEEPEPAFCNLSVLLPVLPGRAQP